MINSINFAELPITAIISLVTVYWFMGIIYHRFMQTNQQNIKFSKLLNTMDEKLDSIQDELYEYSDKLKCLSNNVSWIKYFDGIEMSTVHRDLLYNHIMLKRIHHGKTLYRSSKQYLSDNFDLEQQLFENEVEFYKWLENNNFIKVKINNRSDNYYVFE